MVKGTVPYGHPKDAGAFEKYYAETRLPLVGKTTGNKFGIHEIFSWP